MALEWDLRKVFGEESGLLFLQEQLGDFPSYRSDPTGPLLKNLQCSISADALRASLYDQRGGGFHVSTGLGRSGSRIFAQTLFLGMSTRVFLEEMNI